MQLSGDPCCNPGWWSWAILMQHFIKGARVLVSCFVAWIPSKNFFVFAPHIGSSIRIVFLIPKTSQRWEVKKNIGGWKNSISTSFETTGTIYDETLTNFSQLPFKESWQQKTSKGFQDPFGAAGTKTVRWKALSHYHCLLLLLHSAAEQSQKFGFLHFSDTLKGHLGNTFVGIMVHAGGIPILKKSQVFQRKIPIFWRIAKLFWGGRKILYPQTSRTGVSGFSFALGGLVATNFTQGVFQYITNHFRYLKWRYSPI